jgi:hypothetical protein
MAVGVGTLSMLVLAGCSTSTSSEADLELAWLLGRWEWVSSTGGIAGWTLTPESTGQTRSVEFGADGIMRTVVDGETVLVEEFHVGVGADDGQFDGRTVLLLPGGREVGVTVPSQGRLRLDEGCCDLFVHEYRR